MPPWKSKTIVNSGQSGSLLRCSTSLKSQVQKLDEAYDKCQAVFCKGEVDGFYTEAFLRTTFNELLQTNLFTNILINIIGDDPWNAKVSVRSWKRNQGLNLRVGPPYPCFCMQPWFPIIFFHLTRPRCSAASGVEMKIRTHWRIDWGLVSVDSSSEKIWTHLRPVPSCF